MYVSLFKNYRHSCRNAEANRSGLRQLIKVQTFRITSLNI